MSASLDEGLLLRLKLFESSVSHAWIRWDDPEVLDVETSACPEVLKEKEYILDSIVKNPEEVRKYHEEVSDTVSETSFSIESNGQQCDIKCASIRKGEEVQSLWFIVPEKDNSIFYLQNAAHDFRSPLASILGVVNLMHHSLKKDEKLDREELSTLLDMIRVNTDKTLRLADEIMEMAEIESEGYQLNRTSVVMKDFVENYLATHRLLTLKKQIKVLAEYHTTSRSLINESKLTRALDNVMSNAVKFSGVGSSIVFRLEEKKGLIELSISDQGIGMGKEILKNIFVKFGNSKRTGLDGEPSHGLGMSIVQQIMKLHDGHVEVTSKEGVGTRVSLIFNKEQ